MLAACKPAPKLLGKMQSWVTLAQPCWELVPGGSWQHLCLPAFTAEQLSLGLLQPMLGFVQPRNEGARGGIARREMRCWQEDAQPEGTEPGAWWG